jgi:transmembrane sensor
MSWHFGRKETPRAAPSAADWVVRIRSGTLTRRHRREIQRWMDESPENVRDLLRTEAAWRLAGSLANDDILLHELEELETAAGTAEREPWRAFRALPRWAYALTATVLLVTGWVTWQALAPLSYSTARGEQRLISLADGSVVVLNTDTRLTVDLTATRRTIHLQRGEALFQVAHDARRPFIVYAGAGYTRALGTRFDVVELGGTITVAVLEGRVEVRSREGAKEAPASAPELVEAGQAAAYIPSGESVAPEPTQASSERITAWEEGKLRFDSWLVERAVREYNRYAKKPIRLARGEFGNVRISGVFRIGDTATFVRVLAELVDGKVVDDGDRLTLTSKASVDVAPGRDAAAPPTE